MRFAIIPAVGLTALATVVAAGDAPSPPPSDEIISRSIAYHDPRGAWNSARIRLEIHTTYSEEFAAERNRPREARLTLVLAPGQSEFRCTKTAGDDRVDVSVIDGKGSVAVNGSTDVSDDDRDRLGISEPELYRDYWEYLCLMPMKLGDPGAIVDPKAGTVEFQGRDVYRVRVTYDPEVGSHTWYFYFDPETYALVGYRFFKDEAKNDGEYITFEGEAVDEASGLRLPKVRAWYFNDGDGHLATDDITSIRT